MDGTDTHFAAMECGQAIDPVQCWLGTSHYGTYRAVNPDQPFTYECIADLWEENIDDESDDSEIDDNEDTLQEDTDDEVETSTQEEVEIITDASLQAPDNSNSKKAESTPLHAKKAQLSKSLRKCLHLDQDETFKTFAETLHKL
jgi:hypothetical protein